MKTNIKHTTKHFTLALSLTLASAVFLSASHAKDIIGPPKQTVAILSDASQPAKDPAKEVTAKSISELHSHVDKTMVKDPGLSKTFGDSASLAARREQREDHEDNRSLGHRLVEMMIMAHLALASAFVR